MPKPEVNGDFGEQISLDICNCSPVPGCGEGP
jgi:hypothetical protein